MAHWMFNQNAQWMCKFLAVSSTDTTDGSSKVQWKLLADLWLSPAFYSVFHIMDGRHSELSPGTQPSFIWDVKVVKDFQDITNIAVVAHLWCCFKRQRVLHNWCGSRFLEEGVWWHPPLEHFEISSPQKLDFHHSEAKSACFNISFLRTGSNLVMSF